MIHLMNRISIILSLLLFALSSLHASAQSHHEGLSATKTDLARTHRLKTAVKVTCGTENPLFAAF